MDDRLLVRVEDLQNIVGISAAIVEISDIKCFEIFVTVELFVIGVSDSIELRLVMRHEHRFGITPEIRTCHGDDVDLVAGDELAEMLSEPVIRICGNVMEFIDGDQPVVEGFDSILVHGETEGSVGAHKDLVVTFEKRPDRLDLAPIV